MKLRRRWLRFSLLSMFVVMTLCAVVVALVANRAHRRQDALNAIRSIRGNVTFHKTPESLISRILAQVFGAETFAEVRAIRLRDTEASDATMAIISALNESVELGIEKTKVTD